MSFIIYRLSNVYMSTGTALLIYGLATNDLRLMLGGIALLWFGVNIIMDHLENTRNDGIHVD
jgi:hypothetical protein